MPSNNSNRDPLDSLSISTLLPKFIIPPIVAYLVISLYNIVDQIFTGQGVGYLGDVVTNVAFPFTTVSTTTALMMGIGTAASFNSSLRVGDKKRARRVAGTGLSCLVLFNLTLGLIASFLWGPFLDLFGATPEILPCVMIYTGITAFGLPMVTFTIGASSLTRVNGNPTYSMFYILSDAILSAILNPVFISSLDTGVVGGTLVIMLGRALSLIMVLCYLFRTHIRAIRLTATSLRPSEPLLRAVCSLGVSPFLNQTVMFLVQITFDNTLTYYSVLSHYGRDIPLTYVGVTSKINILMLDSALGIFQGCRPILSYNYDIRQCSRVCKAYREAIVAVSMIRCTALVCSQPFPRSIVALFDPSDSGEHLQFAEQHFRIYTFMALANALRPTATNFSTSINKTKRDILIVPARQAIFLIPLILIFPLLLGTDGVMYTGPIADNAAVVVTLALVTRGVKQMSYVDEPVAADTLV